MKVIVIGIMPQNKIRERILSIARGEYKPKPTEPKIWFTSMRSLAEVLSDENRALLKVIKDTKPRSISSLAEATQCERVDIGHVMFPDRLEEIARGRGVGETLPGEAPAEGSQKCDKRARA